VHYCGIVPMQDALQLAMLEEVRASEPPIGLSAIFFEPGSAGQVADELRSLGEIVVAVGAPLSGHNRELERRGVPPLRESPEAGRLVELLDLPLFAPGDDHGLHGPVPEGAYHEYPLFETHPDGVFYALQGGRLPAKRHPFGMQMRIDELLDDRVTDEGGDLWHRRIEEIDAAACALSAHRYAVGHAFWLAESDDGALVLPGTGLPQGSARQGVVPPVERLQLPPERDQ
jgi:predicted nuclease with RNAse H fold